MERLLNKVAQLNENDLNGTANKVLSPLDTSVPTGVYNYIIRYEANGVNDYPVNSLVTDLSHKLFIVGKKDETYLYLNSYSDDFGSLKFLQNEYNRINSKINALPTVDVTVSAKDVTE